MSEAVVAAAVIAAGTGAALSTIHGWLHNKKANEGYSLPKLFGGLIPSVMAGFALVNLQGVAATDLGLVGVAITNLFLGFGIDRTIAAAKK